MSDEELEIVYENFRPIITSSIHEDDSTENSTSPSLLASHSNPRGVSMEESHRKFDRKNGPKNTLKALKKRKNINVRKQLERSQSHLPFKVVKTTNGDTRRKEYHVNGGGSKMPFAIPITPIKENEANRLITRDSSKSPSASIHQNIRLSPHVSKRPKKFSINGSPASSKKNKNYISNGEKKPMKSVQDTSPLMFMRSKISLRNSPVAADSSSSPDKKGVKRKLNFSFDSPSSNRRLVATNSLDDTLISTANNSEAPLVYDGGYILRQFKLHIDTVLADNKIRNLISEEEIDTINSFFSMDYECRDLYARMHNRKHKWHRLSDIRYNSATSENLDVLKDKGFITTDTQDIEMRSVLDLLKYPEIKELCKSLGLKSNIQNKQSYSEEILRYAQKQRTIGSTFQIESSENDVRRRICDLLGPCFILCPEPCGLFQRIHLLFNLQFNRIEQSAYGSQDLFEIQFAGTNKSLYPNYKIDETAMIFISREELLRYQSAQDLRQKFLIAKKTKDWVQADTILSTVRNNYIHLQFGESPSVSAQDRPLSLRRYTPGSVYVDILYNGVEVLQKVKKIEHAISDLMLILEQSTYLPYERRNWYELLVSIRIKAGHMNKHVADIISNAMADAHVDDLCRYVMSTYIKQMMKKKKGVLLEVKRSLEKISLFPPLESVEPIRINAYFSDGKAGNERIYMQDDDTGVVETYSSVEELVTNHFCPRQFKCGIHSENCLATSLFGVFFWDIIYDCYVPCAFTSPYQAKPFDLDTGEFYENRKIAIDTKLHEMANWTTDQLSSWVKEVFDKQKGRMSVVIWNMFKSSDYFVDIINCIGLDVVLKICERYVKQYRYVRSGFPDLFLWTPGQKHKYKFVEVKGPKETLGVNKKLWLDFLVKINANVDVCLVQAHGAKTSRPILDSEVLPEYNVDEQNKADMTDNNIV